MVFITRLRSVVQSCIAASSLARSSIVSLTKPLSSLCIAAVLAAIGFFTTPATAQVNAAPEPRNFLDSTPKPEPKPEPKPDTARDRSSAKKFTRQGRYAKPALRTPALTIANLGKPQTLDPHKITSVWESRIVGDLFLGLVTEGPDANIVPGVAASWSASDDNYTWTFKLRESLWSNREPVTAHDFVYSFRRAINPDTQAFFAPGLYAIQNAFAIHNRKITDIEQLGVTAVDDYTLEITLQIPDAFFLEQLTHPIAYPVFRDQIEGGKINRNGAAGQHSLISNGAYRLTRWENSGKVRVAKNASFYDATKTNIDIVVYDPDPDVQRAVQKFESGNVHISRDIGVDDIDKLRDDREQEIHITPHLGVYYFTLNLAHLPFQSKSVRQALSMALDRETITDKVLRTGESPAYGLVPPGVSDYKDQSSVEWRFVPYQERVKQARVLMEKAGYDSENPLKFTLDFNLGDENHERIALAATAMWKKIHVDATVVSRSATKHYELLQGGRFQAGRASWLSQHNDASTFLGILHSAVGNLNYGRFKHAEFDDLLHKAASAPIGEQRQQLFAKAQKILNDEQPVIPVYHYVSRNLVSNRVTGWKANAKDVQRTRYLSIK